MGRGIHMRANDARELRGCVDIFIAGVLWGTIGPFMRAMEQLGAAPALTAFFRMAFACVIMAAIMGAGSGRKAFRADKRTILLCALLGLVCHGIYNVFYTSAVAMTGVTVSCVLMNTAPVFTALTSRLLFGEPIVRQKGIALGLNIVGCILVATGGRMDGQGVSIPGILFGLGSGFCYSLTAVIGRLAVKSGDGRIVSVYSYLFAALFLLIFARPFEGGLPTDWRIWLLGIGLALIPTVIAYIFYYKGIKAVSGSAKVPVIASVEIVVAAIMGVAMFGEVMGLANGIGFVMVMGSILMMSKQTK